MNAAEKIVSRTAPSNRLGDKAWSTSLFTLATMVLVVLGWRVRDEYYVTAEHGLGYALGIAGGVMMLLLLLYPLRKRLRVFHHWLPVRHWFRAHMILGVVGPLCILYHCNFSLGATNSNVALMCMFLMVASGVVGRFIYARIHHGLYGQRATLQELQRERVTAEQQLQADGVALAAMTKPLQQLEAIALQRRSVAGNLLRALTFGPRSRWLQWRWQSQLQGAAHKSQRAHLAAYLDTLRRIAGFTFFERLFSLWHVLHMPIFFMLVITGLVHVYAVHLY